MRLCVRVCVCACVCVIVAIFSFWAQALVLLGSQSILKFCVDHHEGLGGHAVVTSPESRDGAPWIGTAHAGHPCVIALLEFIANHAVAPLGSSCGGTELLVPYLHGHDLVSDLEAQSAVGLGDVVRLRRGTCACARLRAMD